MTIEKENQEIEEMQEKIRKNKKINLALKILLLLVLVVALGITIPMIIEIQQGPIVEMM